MAEPKHILVVDDEEDLLFIYKSKLQRAGYQVTTAPNGKDAIEQIKNAKEPFGLILCDINMPGGVNGIGVFEFVKTVPQSKFPFMFITGHAKGEPELEEAEKAGVQVLNKPVNFPELLNLIKSL